MKEPIRFTVHGIPRPAGSKRWIGGKRIIDDCKKSGPWKAVVAWTAREAYSGPLLRGPLIVCMSFYMPRPKGHYGAGKNADKLKASAPRWHVIRPDVLKLARGTEDALTGVIWGDDAQTVCLELHKNYSETMAGYAVIEIQTTAIDEALAVTAAEGK